MENSNSIIIRNVGIEFPNLLPLPHLWRIYILAIIPIAGILYTVSLTDRLSGNALGVVWAITGLVTGITVFIIGSVSTWCNLIITENEIVFSTWAGKGAWKRSAIGNLKTYRLITLTGPRSPTSLADGIVFLLVIIRHFYSCVIGPEKPSLLDFVSWYIRYSWMATQSVSCPSGGFSS